MSRNRVLVTLGDPWGIGPEVTARALLALRPEREQVLLVGEPALWNALCRELGTEELASWPLEAVSAEFPYTPGHPPAAGGSVPLASLRRAVELLQEGQAVALVTAPVNKALIQVQEPTFIGHTEFLGAAFAVAEPTMFFVGPDLLVGLATTHVSLRALPDLIREERVLLHLQRIHEYLCAGTSGERKIAVCGLNPHAGEGGAFGDEEIRVLEPAIAQACAQGIDAAGPFPADTLFKRALAGEFQAVLAMYHDQALTLFKTIDQGRGVNVTLGLPCFRSSPDHGTAYDIADRFSADPSSMASALELALAQVSGYNGHG